MTSKPDSIAGSLFSQLLLPALLCLLLAMISLQPAHAARQALVIGNDNYTSVAKLQKAGNDAAAMARELKAAGFAVQLHRDLNYRAMVRAVENFAGGIKGGDEVVVFFAGHGVQIKNGGYLLPTDIEATSESEVEKTAYELNALTDKLSEAKAAFSLVMVDACRDNPLKTRGRSVGNTRGLSAIEPPKGQMVVYSASKGQQALDRLSDKDANPNSVFTREFIARMKRPGVKIEELVREVQDAVEALAGTIQHEQRPAIYNEARGNFYFFGPTTVQVGSTPFPALYLAPARTPEQIEDETWNIIKIASDQTSLEEYLKQYPKGRYVAQAKIVLAQVKADNKRASIAPTAAATSATDGADVEYALWQAISTGNTVDDYEVYIQQYPRGKYAPLARQRIQKKTDEAAAKAQAIEASAWQAVEASKTLESYQGYLKNHPSGIHSALAKTQIENIKDDQSRQEESRAWKMAQSGGVKELKIYLERYATGTYAFEASALLDMLQKAEAKLKIEKNSDDDEVKWGWPASGTVAANFDGASNKGIAFNGNGGDAVLAAAEGLVAYAGSGLRGYGNLIILKHNTIYLTSYAHNQTLLVKEGEAVRKGQKIAEMGNSSADQAKFQFEIRKSGKPIDPINLLPVR